MSDTKTCDRCASDCSRGWSERWRGETAETAVLVETLCNACDLQDHVATYRSTGRLCNGVVLPAALYQQVCGYTTGGADGGWVEWMRGSDRAKQREDMLLEVEAKKARYGADYDKINAEVTGLCALVAAFEQVVWFSWLKRYYAGTNLRGHTAKVDAQTMLVWGCAGRLMVTLQQPDKAASITLICAEDSFTPTMGVQGYDCTEAQGRALLCAAIAQTEGLRAAIVPDNQVGIGL